MTDDQIRDIVLSNFPRLATTISWHEVSQFARALLSASKPAAIDGQEAVSKSRCLGMNCYATDGINHSLECHAEHAAAVAGGQFIKPAGQVDRCDSWMGRDDARCSDCKLNRSARCPHNDAAPLDTGASKGAAPAQSGEPIGWAWKPRGGSLDFSDAQDRPSEIDFQHAKAAGGEFVPLFVSPQPSPTAVVLDDERAAFAAWGRKHGCVAIEKTWTEDACWFAWQARAASPQPVETGDATQ